LEQAKRYAAGVGQGSGNWNAFKVPFLFASNGEVIWFIDMRDEKPASRQIAQFHTATALDALFSPKGNPPALREDSRSLTIPGVWGRRKSFWENGAARVCEFGERYARI
jgi:type I site-specific restriction endonuclease